MGEEIKKHPLNVRGRYYVTEYCLACEDCQISAPNNFRYAADGLSYVFKQPDTPDEEAQCREAVDSCPMEAIRDDGDGGAGRAILRTGRALVQKIRARLF